MSVQDIENVCGFKDLLAGNARSSRWTKSYQKQMGQNGPLAGYVYFVVLVDYGTRQRLKAKYSADYLRLIVIYHLQPLMEPRIDLLFISHIWNIYHQELDRVIGFPPTYP